MAEMTLADLSEKMGKIDFGMLSTRTLGGAVASRPMSNNGEVEYLWRQLLLHLRGCGAPCRTSKAMPRSG